jgi:hypothetical protein
MKSIIKNKTHKRDHDEAIDILDKQADSVGESDKAQKNSLDSRRETLNPSADRGSLAAEKNGSQISEMGLVSGSRKLNEKNKYSERSQF